MSSNDTPTKTCTQCGETFPATTEYWHRNKRSKDGFRSECKSCKKRYYKDGRGREYGKQYRTEHAESRKQWYIDNADHLREYHKQYYLEHAESIKRASRENYTNNKERATETNKRWAMANIEKTRSYKRRNRARRRNAEGTHTADDIELQIASQTKDGKLYCWWCGKEIKRRYHIDHRIPLAKGGSNNAGNLCITHPKCNMSKQDKMPWEFNGRLI